MTAPPRQPSLPDERKWQALRRIWRQAKPITPGDPAGRYLARRGLAGILEAVPSTLRYHPHLAYAHPNGRFTYHPTLVAAVQAPDGKVVSIHRTYLTPDGHKADVPSPRKLMPAPVPGATRGAAIRLYPAADMLVVAEGIETALAVHLATGLPTWATICAGGMARLVVPDTVRLVVITADHDDAGLQAAATLARRLLAEGRRVKLLTPATPGCDFADLCAEEGMYHAAG